MARGASLTLDLISQTSFSLSSTFHSHSRPQSPRSFWPVAGIESSGRTRFSEYAQSIRFVFSTNQIRWEVRESWTSGVRPSQSSRSLPQARRIVGSGDENDFIPLCITGMLSTLLAGYNVQHLPWLNSPIQGPELTFLGRHQLETITCTCRAWLHIIPHLL